MLRLALYLAVASVASVSASEFDEVVTAIATRGISCIRQVDGENLYLNPQLLFPTSEGLFLLLNGNDSILGHCNTVGCQYQGMYVLESEPPTDENKSADSTQSSRRKKR